MARLFEPLTLRRLTLPNRIAVSPMCQYSARDGLANDWHLVHLGSRASGGAGLVMVEATAVVPEGRISPQDLGIWSDDHLAPLARITRFIESQGAVPAIQLAHAGRKASTWRPWEDKTGSVPESEGGWSTVAPSAIAFDSNHTTPKALSREEIQGIIDAFVRAAERSLEAGFKIAEIHAAHGYLLHQFLSPLSNQREDAYGGSFDNRARLLLEVTAAVRRVWPDEWPLFVRLSATDWEEGGWNIEETVQLAQRLKALGVDLIDVSSGGTTPTARIPVGPGYQTAFAERVHREADIATSAVGMITSAEQAEHILHTGQADMIMLARELLRDPYWPLHAAQALRHEVPWPAQYARAAHRDTPIHVANVIDD
ncbi:NADH:flavin oxidoreductase/NADH oxidase [Halomonas shantousis]